MSNELHSNSLPMKITNEQQSNSRPSKITYELQKNSRPSKITEISFVPIKSMNYFQVNLTCTHFIHVHRTKAVKEVKGTLSQLNLWVSLVQTLRFHVIHPNYFKRRHVTVIHQKDLDQPLLPRIGAFKINLLLCVLSRNTH